MRFHVKMVLACEVLHHCEAYVGSGSFEVCPGKCKFLCNRNSCFLPSNIVLRQSAQPFILCAEGTKRATQAPFYEIAYITGAYVVHKKVCNCQMAENKMPNSTFSYWSQEPPYLRQALDNAEAARLRIELVEFVSRSMPDVLWQEYRL